LTEEAAGVIWRQSITLLEKDRPGAPVAQFARSAASTWRMLQEWQAGAAEEWIMAGLSPDQQAFLRWSGEFRSRCESSGWITVDELPALLTADVAAGLFDSGVSPLLFVGFDEWSPARQHLREALAERGVTIELAGVQQPASRVSAHHCLNQDEELYAAANWAATQLREHATASIGIVIPDLAARADQVRRVFLDVLAPAWRTTGVPPGLPLNISYGRSLAVTPSVHAALLLMRLTTRKVAFSELSQLLRSPWFRNGSSEAAERARFEIRLRDTQRIELALTDIHGDCSKYAPGFLPVLDCLIERAQQNERRSAAEWGHWLTELLQAVGWPGDVSPDSETWQTLQAWNELLATFAATADLQGKLTQGEASAGLLQFAQQRLFQPEGTHNGIQVMGALEAAGQEFELLRVCGMARELWPDASRPDPYVPLKLQRRLGLPDSSPLRVYEHTALLTQRLLGSAAEVVVSWPGTMDEEALSLSPLITRAISTTTSQGIPLWKHEMLAAHQLEALNDDSAPPWSEGARVRGGASVLNLQAVSPFNAFVEKRLGAFEVRRPPVGIDAMQRGNLTHAALEYFYTDIADRATLENLTPAQREAQLQAAIVKAAQEIPGSRNAFIRRLIDLELIQQSLRINEFIEVDLKRPDFQVIELEKKHDVSFGPVSLQLKLDRLDRLASGQEFVIDYKTGQVKRQDWNPAKVRNLQLPFYVTVVAPKADAVAFAQVSVQGIEFDGVGVDSTGIAGIRSPGRKQVVQVRYQFPQTADVIESWDELRDEWAMLLLDLAEQFARGDFRLDPKNPGSARSQFAVLSRIYDAGVLLEEGE
jgi:ATP-dependent helicase/nuclease subunit B